MKYFFGIFLYFFFTFSIFIFLYFFRDSYVEYINPGNYNYFFFWILSLQLLFFLISGILIPKIFWIKRERKTANKKIYLYGILIFLILSLTLDFIFKNLWERQDTSSIFITLGFPLSLFLAVFLAFLEEKIFREVLQGTLQKKIHYVSAIIISSGVFALLHNQGLYNLPIFFLGLFLGYIYYKYKDIKLNVFIHGINNAIGIILLFLFTNTSIPGVSSYILSQSTVLDRISYQESQDVEAIYFTIRYKYDPFYTKEKETKEELEKKKEEFEIFFNKGKNKFSSKDLEHLNEIRENIDKALNEIL